MTNKNTGGKVKAALPVHMLGTPVDMQALTWYVMSMDFALLKMQLRAQFFYNGAMTGTLEVA